MAVKPDAVDSDNMKDAESRTPEAPMRYCDRVKSGKPTASRASRNLVLRVC